MKMTIRGAAMATLALAMTTLAWSAEPSAPSPLDRLKALAGEWVDASDKPESKDAVASRFSVSAAGSVVVETMFPGTSHEMVNVYHLDKDDLVVTHYCAAGNQPRMRCKRPGAEKIEFAFDGGTNIDPDVEHMSSVTLSLLGPDELKADWVSVTKGKAGPPETFHLKRKK